MRDALRDGLSTVAEFVPKLALFLVILVVGIIIAKVIAKALNALLEKAGFDRAVERGGIKRALANSKMDASDIVAKLIYYTLMLFVLQLAFGVFGPNPIRTRARTRSGALRASSRATSAPMEWPMIAAWFSFCASSSPSAQAAIAAMLPSAGPADLSWPGRSGASAAPP